MLTQEAPSIRTCTPRVAMDSPSSQIFGSDDSDNAAPTEPPLHHHPPMGSSDESSVDVPSVESCQFPPQIAEDHAQPTPLGDGLCNLSSQNDCNPTFVEGETKQVGVVVVDMNECASVKHDFNTTCGDKQADEHEMEHCNDDDNRAGKVHVDVNACISQMEKLSAREFHEGQDEVSPTNEHLQNAVPPSQAESNDGVLELSSGKKSKEESTVTTPPRKPAAWCTPEPKDRAISEPGFIMEASSWPTLAEARHAKPAEVHASPSHKEKDSVSSPVRKENPMEPPKHLNSNPSQPGSRYRSSYKKGSVPGYSKPSFPATENIPVPTMGVHVPSANTFNPGHFIKGNGRAGVNNYFPGPHQAPANGALYHHRAEGLTPFPHNSAIMTPYGRGHPGWQQHGRSYSVTYDQQHIGPRHMHPPMAPFMNINGVHYNYPNFMGDMSYMPSAFSPGYNYANPYFGPSGAPGGSMQALSPPTVQMMLQRQIEYYFSKENLIKDFYLKSQMDEEDFVPVSVIAKFPRVRQLTSDSMFILEALKYSSVVEVKNNKLRSREWRRRLSGTSQTHGVESLESFSLVSNTGAREQGPKESGEGALDKMTTLPESR